MEKKKRIKADEKRMLKSTLKFSFERNLVENKIMNIIHFY